MIIETTGDLLQSDCDIRCHQVNCKGIMGAGLAKQVSIKYAEVLPEYLRLCNKFGKDMLGDVLYFQCHDGHTLANLFAQNGFGRDRCYTQYDAVEKCIANVFTRASQYDLTVAFPFKMGCDRGGGDWSVIFGIIKKYFERYDNICEIVRIDP